MGISLNGVVQVLGLIGLRVKRVERSVPGKVLYDEIGLSCRVTIKAETQASRHRPDRIVHQPQILVGLTL